MSFRFHRVIDLAQGAFRVNEKGFSLGPPQQAPAVIPDNCFLRVREQLDVQSMLVNELAVAVHIIRADAHRQSIEGCVLFEAFSKSLCFQRSVVGVIFRVEKQQYPLPPELRQ